jgi:signal transduction histidine kinase
MIDNACEWGTSAFLIFSENVGSLIYYTHIFPLVISLLLGFQILINNPGARVNRVLFFITAIFSVWVYFNLILWASPTPELVMFFWSLIVPVELLMYLASLYLVYLFSHNQSDAPIGTKVLWSLTLLPLLLFAHTSLNVIGLSPDCDTGAFEGILIQYMYVVEVIIIFACIYFITQGIRTIKDGLRRKQLLFIGISTIIFLSFFTAGNLTLFFDLGPYYEQYKLFGMPVFALLVGYTIVKFRAFKVKTLLTEMLVSLMWVLMFSMLLFRDMSNARPIIFITVVLFGIIGIILSKAVRREVEQKQEIQKLAKNLEEANVRLRELDKQKSEFVSIASHQLRSPLAAIRGYASMVLEGSFGKVEEKMAEPLGRIAESAKLMNDSVEDFLSVSRIEGGNMKYELADFNVRDLAEHITDDLRPEGFKKGLLLLFKTNMTSKGLVHADKGKVQQIMHNLINNSLKYTQKGTVTVYVHDDVRAKRIIIDIIDTGIGMSEDTIHTLFEKFTRAKNANQVNIKGTGLGLFVAREMARAMGGDVVAHSDGEGKGSRFEFVLPVIL